MPTPVHRNHPVSAAGAYRIVTFILLALLVFTRQTARARSSAAPFARQGGAIATTGSTVIGFYDGLFGAGIGAFYKMLFVRRTRIRFHPRRRAGQVHHRRLQSRRSRHLCPRRSDAVGARDVDGDHELHRRPVGQPPRVALWQRLHLQRVLRRRDAAHPEVYSDA